MLSEHFGAQRARKCARAPNFYLIECAWSLRWLLHQKRMKNLKNSQLNLKMSWPSIYGIYGGSKVQWVVSQTGKGKKAFPPPKFLKIKRNTYHEAHLSIWGFSFLEGGFQVFFFGNTLKTFIMRGIKATNLEYKESLVQVELKIDPSKLRH